MKLNKRMITATTALTILAGAALGFCPTSAKSKCATPPTPPAAPAPAATPAAPAAPAAPVILRQVSYEAPKATSVSRAVAEVKDGKDTYKVVTTENGRTVYFNGKEVPEDKYTIDGNQIVIYTTENKPKSIALASGQNQSGVINLRSPRAVASTAVGTNFPAAVTYTATANIAAPKVMLGVSVESPSDFARAHFDLPEGAVIVERVFPGLPAAKGGIKAHDIIVKIDGKTLGDTGLSDRLGKFEPGDEIEIVVIRGNDKVDLDIELIAYEAAALSGDAEETVRLGQLIEPREPRAARAPRAPRVPGLVIRPDGQNNEENEFVFEWNGEGVEALRKLEGLKELEGLKILEGLENMEGFPAVQGFRFSSGNEEQLEALVEMIAEQVEEIAEEVEEIAEEIYEELEDSNEDLADSIEDALDELVDHLDDLVDEIDDAVEEMMDGSEGANRFFLDNQNRLFFDSEAEEKEQVRALRGRAEAGERARAMYEERAEQMASMFEKRAEAFEKQAEAFERRIEAMAKEFEAMADNMSRAAERRAEELAQRLAEQARRQMAREYERRAQERDREHSDHDHD